MSGSVFNADRIDREQERDGGQGERVGVGVETVIGIEGRRLATHSRTCLSDTPASISRRKSRGDV